MVEPKKIIENFTPYNDEIIQDKKWRLKLDLNENIYGVSNYIFNALKNYDFNEISNYPSCSKLINKLSSFHNRSKENFLLTNGSMDALNLLINTYLDKDDEILSYSLDNSLLEKFALLQGAKLKIIEYQEKFKFNTEHVEKNITNTAKIFYCQTPDDITGNVVKTSLLRCLIEKFPNILFIINCSYINYADDINLEDYLDLIEKYDNVAVIKSFSSDYALSGIRLGFIYSNKQIISNVEKINLPFNINSLSLYCGYSALCNESYIEETKLLNFKARNLLFDGLKEKGFEPYLSEANFILCNFFDYVDYYYEKFKQNGVLVKKFPKSSPVSTCLRITVPKIGGVKFILELLNKKDVLIFNPDSIIFDESDSYDCAISETFKHFMGFPLTKTEIFQAKNHGKCNKKINLIKYLLNENNFNADIDEIEKIYQEKLHFKSKNNKTLIDEDKLIISEEILEELSKKYDMVIYSDRLSCEIKYSLEKFEIDKYFYYSVNADDLIDEFYKPNPQGVAKILKHCPHKSIKYIGSTVDDIITGNGANVDTIGVITPNSDFSFMINNFKHLGAKYILKDINKISTFLDEIDKKINYLKNEQFE